MSFNDYRARFADMSTYAVGDVAYWDNAQSWGSGISQGVVTKVTKTQVTVEFLGNPKVFRWQPARRILMDKCGWNDYNHHELVTPATGQAALDRHALKEKEKTFRDVLATAAKKAFDKGATVEDIEAAIEEMQAQLQLLKDLRDA